MNEVYIGISVQIILAVIMPIVLLIIFQRKKWLSWKSLGIGVLIFFVFSQVLEKMLHIAVLAPTGTQLKWSANPYLFAIYGGLAAGIFEEMGRFFAFKLLLKKNHQYNDGLSYGLGHGGIEAILIGGLSGISSIILYSMVQSGAAVGMLGETPIPKEQLANIQTQFADAQFWIFAAGGMERIFALALHLALSLLVLYGVKQRQFTYVLYAILFHAGVNFLPALYQVGVIKSLLLVESMLFIVAIFCLYFIVKIKGRFADPT